MTFACAVLLLAILLLHRDTLLNLRILQNAIVGVADSPVSTVDALEWVAWGIFALLIMNGIRLARF